MALADKKHLKRPSRSRKDGWLPDENPRFGPLLVEKWHGEADDNIARASASARFRHSDAGACSRMLAYAALGLPARQMDAAGHFITRQGHNIHDALQEVLVSELGATVENKVSINDDMAGHEDVEVGPTSIEIKSLGGFAYKKAVGDRGPAQGPKHEHLIQGSLNAKARNAEELVIVYVAREAISLQGTKRAKLDDMTRVVAEWTISRETYEPIADKEIERVTAILGLLDAGLLPKRKVPDPELPVNHLITDPRNGGWIATDEHDQVEAAGEYWGCPYCRYQEICVQTPADRCKISEVPVVVEALAAGDG